MMRLSATALETRPGITHAFFTRQGGVSDGIYASLNGGQGSDDRPEDVRENRRRMVEAMQAEHLITVHQHHSADVVTVDGPFADAPPKADAMVTSRPGIALGILTADCGPLLFVDDKAGVIGAAHAGWGGAFKGVIEATLQAMTSIGADRSRIVVALGPTLAQKSYEVGPEFRARFLEQSADHARFFVQPDDAPRPFFDLPAYIKYRVLAAGIGESHYQDVMRDTYAEPDLFFSYRRSVHRKESDYGRQVACIKLQ